MTDREEFIQGISQKIQDYHACKCKEDALKLSKSLLDSIGLIDKIDNAMVTIDYHNVIPIRIGNRVCAWYDEKIYFLTNNVKSNIPFGVCLTENQVLEIFNDIENSEE